MTDPPALLRVIQRYFERNPDAAAHSLETMTEEEAVEVLKLLPSQLSSQAVKRLHGGFAARVLQQLPAELFRDIVGQLDPEHGASIFFHLALAEMSIRFRLFCSHSKSGFRG